MRKTCILVLSIAATLSSHAQMMGNGKNNNGNGNYNNNYNNNYNSFLSITNLSAEDIQFEVDGQTYVDCGPA